MWEMVHHACLAQDFHHWNVDGIEPMRDSFFIADLTLLFQAHEITVDVDMLHERLVLTGYGQV